MSLRSWFSQICWRKAEIAESRLLGEENYGENLGSPLVEEVLDT